MTRRTYPRIGRLVPKAKNTAARCPCGALGRFVVHIEYTYMRGDDETEWRCEDHKGHIAKPDKGAGA